MEDHSSWNTAWDAGKTPRIRREQRNWWGPVTDVLQENMKKLQEEMQQPFQMGCMVRRRGSFERTPQRRRNYFAEAEAVRAVVRLSNLPEEIWTPELGLIFGKAALTAARHPKLVKNEPSSLLQRQPGYTGSPPQPPERKSRGQASSSEASPMATEAPEEHAASSWRPGSPEEDDWKQYVPAAAMDAPSPGAALHSESLPSEPPPPPARSSPSKAAHPSPLPAATAPPLDPSAQVALPSPLTPRRRRVLSVTPAGSDKGDASSAPGVAEDEHADADQPTEPPPRTASIAAEGSFWGQLLPFAGATAPVLAEVEAAVSAKVGSTGVTDKDLSPGAAQGGSSLITSPLASRITSPLVSADTTSEPPPAVAMLSEPMEPRKISFKLCSDQPTVPVAIGRTASGRALRHTKDKDGSPARAMSFSRRTASSAHRSSSGEYVPCEPALAEDDHTLALVLKSQRRRSEETLSLPSAPHQPLLEGGPSRFKRVQSIRERVAAEAANREAPTRSAAEDIAEPPAGSALGSTLGEFSLVAGSRLSDDLADYAVKASRGDQLRARARTLGYANRGDLSHPMQRYNVSVERVDLGIRQPSAQSPTSEELTRSKSLPGMGRHLLSRLRRRPSADVARAPAAGSLGDFGAMPVRDTEKFWRNLNQHLDPAITDEQRDRIKTALCKLAHGEQSVPVEKPRSVQMQWLKREMWPESYSQTEDLAFGV